MPESKIHFLRVLIIICFLGMISTIEFVRMALFITFLPSFLTSLKFGLASLGLIMSVNLLADNLSKSATGWLVDHYGPWPVLFIGSLLVAAGLWLIRNFYLQEQLLILGALLIGIGVSPTWPAVVSGSIKIAGEKRKATMLSIISVTWLVGGGLGPVLMGFMIDSGKRISLVKYHLIIKDAYRFGFNILGVISAIAIIVSGLAWLVWSYLSKDLQPTHSCREQHPKLKAIITKLWEIKGLIPGMLIQTVSLGMLLPNLLPFVTGKLGLSESQYSLLLIVGGFFVVVFLVPVGYLADKLGARAFLVAGFFLASAALFTTASYASRQNIWFIAGWIGFSYALIQPAWNALLTGAIPPGQRGVLMGLFMSVEGLGFSLGPLIGGILGNLHNSFAGLPFYISSICLLIMSVVYLFYPFQHHHNEV